jgi:PAS domain S-box-containing protein
MKAERPRVVAATGTDDRLARVFETVPDGLSTLDTDGRITSANAGADAILGVPPGGLIGRYLKDLLRQVASIDGEQFEPATIVERYERAIAAGEPYAGFHGTFDRADGQRLILWMKLAALHDSTGERDGIVASFADVTRERADQAQLAAKVAELTATSEFGHLALTGAPIQALMVEAATIVARVLAVEYSAVLELLPGGEHLLLRAGMGWAEGQVGTATVPADRTTPAGSALLDGVPMVVNDFGAEPRLVGSALLTSHEAVAGISVIVGSAEKPFGVLGAYTTRRRTFRHGEAEFMTAIASTLGSALARHTAEDERWAAERRGLESERLSALGQMASGVAHDLAQSLALVGGYGQVLCNELERRRPDRTTLRETAAIIVTAASDGGETIRRVLRFARADEVGQASRVEVADLLHEVARLTAPLWRNTSQAEGRSIQLSVDAPERMAIVGWPGSLRQALTNLVLNAIDALPEGGTIVLRSRHDGEQVVVEVVDSGVGMAADVRARALKPFFTTKGERGTGLGLAQVFGIAERHRGRVAISSSPGQGTTVRLSFPAAVEQEPASTEPSPRARGRRRLRVLAVDDEPRLGRMMALMLKRRGDRVFAVTSGEEALERLVAEPFDVVVSDLSLGEGINGWGLAEQVRRRWPQTRFVMATGWGAAIDEATARAGGVAVVIAKPYHQSDLERALVDDDER